MQVVVDRFHRNFTHHGEIGAALSVWLGGKEILHLCEGNLHKDGGPSWTSHTMVPVYSATKGPAALTLLLALHESHVALDSPVRSIWPGLALPLTFGELLSHQAGLPALDRPPSVYDHAAVIAALEHQVPAWTPGTAHGYHPRTFGFLLDECVRRLCGGTSLGEVWQQRFAVPLGLDFWIGGIPESRYPDIARLYPGRPKTPHPDETGFFEAMADPASLTRRAFQSPAGLHAVTEMNQPAAWQAALPAFGGVGSAHALGKFYAVLANHGRFEHHEIIPETVWRQCLTPLSHGLDHVLQLPTRFSAGFMMDPLAPGGSKLRQRFGPNPQAFGHPGAGGSHAFADPVSGLSFAYVMNQMEPGILPNHKCLDLLEAVLNEIAG